ncbi:MAG TPA: hypothetical protein VGH15_05820 [Caulobacteraceae bacterium]|jgi:hypothetical protein
MSWLTVFLRKANLGGVLDAIEAAEKDPNPTTIATAVGAATAAIPAAPDLAITAVGSMVGDLLVEAATKVNPEAGQIASAYVPGLLQRLETVLEAELANISGGLIKAPTPEGG